MLPFLTLFALYLLFAGQASAAELGAAVLAGTAAAGYHLHVRCRARRKFHLVAPWLRLAWRIPLALARDTTLVGWGLLRAIADRDLHGGQARQPFHPGGFTPQAAAHRALAVLAASVAPNSYVVEVLEPPGGLLMHRLVPRPPEADRRWPV